MRRPRTGVADWAVPAGAEFDSDPERGYDPTPNLSSWALSCDPWYRMESLDHGLPLGYRVRPDELGIDRDFDLAAYLDEEDPEAGMPARPRYALQPHEGVFDDLADLAAWVSPDDWVEAVRRALSESGRIGRPPKPKPEPRHPKRSPVPDPAKEREREVARMKRAAKKRNAEKLRAKWAASEQERKRAESERESEEAPAPVPEPEQLGQPDPRERLSGYELAMYEMWGAPR